MALIEDMLAQLPGAGLVSLSVFVSLQLLKSEFRAQIKTQTQAILIFLDEKTNGNSNNSAFHDALKESNK